MVDDESGRSEVHWVPLGVVGGIGPWNWPMMISVWQIAPALRMGNTIVLKPSEYTPLSVLALAHVMNTALPADVLHEDEHCMAFRDVSPEAPTHFLVIPKRDIVRLGEASPEHKELLGHLLLTAANVGKQLGVDQDGTRIVINNGAGAGQSVFHLHVHVLAGRPLSWPPG